MSYDPTQLDDLGMLELLALGLIPYMDEVLAGEANPFPNPEICYKLRRGELGQ